MVQNLKIAESRVFILEAFSSDTFQENPSEMSEKVK